MPTFLMIGAAKSGTTSLYHYLRQHPAVFMPKRKEPNFFSFDGETLDTRGPGIRRQAELAVLPLARYQALFDQATTETALGEATNNYLYLPRAPKRIQHYVPDCKLIAILRHPVERGFSQFLHNLSCEAEPLLDYGQAVEAEPERIRADWATKYHYVAKGFYHKQLKRYYERFDPAQIRVYLYEDLEIDPAGLVREIFEFIGVDPSFQPDTSLRHNVSRTFRPPRGERWHRLLYQSNPLRRALKRILPAPLRERVKSELTTIGTFKPILRPELRCHLLELYRNDILQLQELIGRNLGHWLR